MHPFTAHLLPAEACHATHSTWISAEGSSERFRIFFAGKFESNRRVLATNPAAQAAAAEANRVGVAVRGDVRVDRMVFGLAAVVNPHVEAHRLQREQAHHKKRLAEIRGKKAVTVSTWDRGVPTDHQGSYGHLQPGRHTPQADADRALRMRQANHQQTERLDHHKKREPAQHVREAAQRKLGVEPVHQRRCEQGRVDLDKGHRLQRKQAQASLARDNQAHQRRIDGVQARVASPSVLRVLRGEVEGKPNSFRTPARCFQGGPQ